MIAKNCEGRAPVPGPLSDEDRVMLDQAWGLADRTRVAMKDFALHQALAEIWRVVADANRYFASEEPWAKGKRDPARRDTILWTTAEVIRNVAIMAQPFIPAAAAKLLDLVGSAEDAREFASAGEGARIPGGLTLPPPQPVFPRYIEAEVAPKPDANKTASKSTHKPKT